MIPNLLDDLLRAWETHPPASSAPALAVLAVSVEDTADHAEPPPAVEPQTHDDPHGPHTAFPPQPPTLLPADPFGALTSPPAGPTAANGLIMDSLLTSLLASYPSTPVVAASAPEAPTPKPGSASAQKFVAAAIGGHKYVLPIESVLEAGRYPKVTYVPGMAPHIRGVFNFRGQVVPVISLRAFAAAAFEAEDTNPESARILTVQSSNRISTAALIFDSLEGIVSLEVEAADTRAAQQFPLSAMLSGLCQNGADLFGVISIDRLLEDTGCTETEPS